MLAAVSTDLWHQRLGHLGRAALSTITSSFDFQCNKTQAHTCHACQIGKSVRQPYSASSTIATSPFHLLHCDVWTSPIVSNSGFAYFLVVLDDHTHYAWTFPLRRKSDVFEILITFHAFVSTQFQRPILAFRTDNGREFDNRAFRVFLAKHGIAFQLSCPYSSPQNGRAERIIRTLTEGLHSLLFHASLSPKFWPDALATITYLLNRRPCRPHQLTTPFELLHGSPPSYQHLRVFGCLCYPNTTASSPHKLAPRSRACVFLGYPPDHAGYKCFDPQTGRVYLSRSVFFDEHVFPFA